MANIQNYFSSMRLENIRQYLLTSGWELSDNCPSGQILFIGPEHDQGGRYELYFPDAEDHPKFHDRVQRSIFNLSCIEDREPMEVAVDMAACREAVPEREPVEKATVSQGETGLTGIELENGSDQDLSLRLGSSDLCLKLQPGDAVTLKFDGSDKLPRITSGSDLLKIDFEGKLHVYQTRIGVSGDEPAPVSAIVDEEFTDFVAHDRAEMKATFARADFGLAAGGNGPSVHPALQQAAIVTASIAGQFDESDEDAHALALWRIACRMINFSGAGLRRSVGSERAFWQLAVEDDPLAPHRVLAWLTEHVEESP